MVDAIIAAMIGAVVGMMAFVIVKSVMAGIQPGSLSAVEAAIIDLLPIVIGIMTLVGVFTALAMRGEGIGIDFVAILHLPFKLLTLMPLLAGVMFKLSLPRKKFKSNLIKYQLIAEELGISKEQLEKELGKEIVIAKNRDTWSLDGNKVYLNNSYQWFITNKKKDIISTRNNITIFTLVGVHKRTDSTVNLKLTTKKSI